MRGRSRLRTRGRTGSNSLLSRATALLGTAPLHYWDFTTNRALFNGVDVGAVTATPNWSFTRASTGYAQTVADTLTAFASGELRRTDKGVLIEGAGTNLCLQSQTFDNATWIKDSSTVSANATTAPDGTLTADGIVPNVTSGAGVHQNITISTATAYVISFYVKYLATLATPWMQIATVAGATKRSYVNVSTGAVGTVGHTSVTSASLGNGWYRFAVLYTSAGTGESVYLQPCPADNNAGNVTTGDGTTPTFYLWGAQVEQASFPSSYIPTTTASATRAADVLTVSSPGVTYPLSLFAEFERASDSGAVSVFFEVDDNTNNERAALTVNASDLPTATMVAATVAQSAISIGSALAVGVVAKLAGRFALNDAQAARGGALGTADTVATLPVTPTFIRFGEIASTGTPAYGYIRRAAIFNTALADAALQRATT